jgi:hypothetical protein
LSFSFTERTFDRASLYARARLESRGFDVLTVAHGPDRVIVATVSPEPRKTPPLLISGGAKRKVI